MPDPHLLAHCQARCGSVVGDRWRLDGLLGMGGMAAVYVATHTIGRREAIKILHPSLAGSPDLVARFEREARAVNAFHHPGAVDIRDLGRTADGCPYLVMELLEGETLGQRVERLGGLPREELFRLADELLDVLGTAHASGIVHRDLKLENLFVTREGRLKVLDFGIAHVASQRRITHLGDVIGTLSYMAPEQVAGEGIDARTDLFSVGVVLFRVLAGRRVHAAQSEESLVLAMGTTQVPPIRTVSPAVEPGLATVIDRALRFKKEERFQSAAEMRAALRACGPANTPAGPAPLQPTTAPGVPARAGSRVALWLALAALLTTGIAVAAVVTLRRGDAGGDSADTGDSEEEAPRRKKAKRKAQASGRASASASLTLSPSQPTSPPPAELGELELESALTRGYAAAESRFGKTAPLTRISLNTVTVVVSTVVSDDPTHVDEFVAQVGVAAPEFRDFGHSTRDPGKPEDRSFALADLPQATLTAIVRDARGRIKDKSAKPSVVSCMHLLDFAITASGKVEKNAPLRCTVVASSKYGSEVFSYRHDGTFIDPNAPR